MRKTIAIIAVFALAFTLTHAALATNGTNLIGIGPISRAMGGAGVAAPGLPDGVTPRVLRSPDGVAVHPSGARALSLVDLLALSDLFGPVASVGFLGGRRVTFLRGFETHLENTHCGSGKNSTHRSVSSVDWI